MPFCLQTNFKQQMKIITFLQQIKHRNTAGKGKNLIHIARDKTYQQLEKIS